MEEFENGNTKREEETHELEPENALDEDSEFNEYTNKDVFGTEVAIESMEPPVATSYSEEQPVEETAELAVEKEVELDSAAEAEGRVVLESLNGDVGVPSDVGAEHNLVSQENGPSSENSGPVDGNKNCTEDENNSVIDTENREINQIPIPGIPSLTQRSSWGGCCGLFQFLRRSDD